MEKKLTTKHWGGMKKRKRKRKKTLGWEENLRDYVLALTSANENTYLTKLNREWEKIKMYYFYDPNFTNFRIISPPKKKKELEFGNKNAILKNFVSNKYFFIGPDIWHNTEYFILTV